MKNITIIGSGSFGCALAYVLSNNNNIKIWSYTKEETNSINNDHKCLFLPELKLDEKIKCYQSYEESLKDSEIVVIVTPSSVFKNTCESIKNHITNQDIVIATKGLSNNRLLSDIAKEIFNKEVSVVSGPSHAEQIAENIPTYVDFCGNKELIKVFETDLFKLEFVDDIVGIQVGAALKNIISLGCGILEGLNYKSNTISYYITEGLKEINTISISMGAKPETIYGLAGLGDLLTTSLSLDSRNKRAGILLGKGKSIEEVKQEIGMTIESFEVLKSVKNIINNKELDCKLINNLYSIIYENKEINSILV